MSFISGQIQKNQAVTLSIVLRSTADGRILVNPAVAAGDFQISVGGAAFANLTNLPVVNPAGSESVELSLTAAETNASNVLIVFKDQTVPAAWEDGDISIAPTEALTDLSLLRKAVLNKRTINANTNVETIYDDDGVTVLKTLSHTETSAGIITQDVA